MSSRNHEQTLEGPVQTLQSVWEFHRLLELYRRVAPLKVLEIGTAYGGSLYHFLQFTQYGATVVSIDSYKKSEWYGPKDNRVQYDAWAPVGVKVLPFQGMSNDPEIVDLLGDYAPFDWIFIDAGHEYEEVKSDWETYMPLASRDGVIALHDIKGDHPGVVQLWEEIRAQGFLIQELVSTSEPYVRDGLGIGIVYMASA